MQLTHWRTHSQKTEGNKCENVGRLLAAGWNNAAPPKRESGYHGVCVCVCVCGSSYFISAWVLLYCAARTQRSVCLICVLRCCDNFIPHPTLLRVCSSPHPARRHNNAVESKHSPHFVFFARICLRKCSGTRRLTGRKTLPIVIVSELMKIPRKYVERVQSCAKCTRKSARDRAKNRS